MLKRVDSVYYSPAIHLVSSSNSKANPTPRKQLKPKEVHPEPLLQLTLLLRVGSKPRTLQKLGMPTKVQSKALT